MVSSQFGRYRILSRIGRGGMGEVYLAEDPTLGRKVALKFILPGLDGDTQARRRLLHEARAAAQLDHPFVCKVYEVGEQDGTAYLATEYVEGETLKQRLAAPGRLAQADVIRIAREVAEALHFGHARGVVHRDLKPANVMIAGDGHAKVMDFGVAKRLAAPLGPSDATAAASIATVPGEITGTIPYMSPEQIRAEPVDARSDIFAFGVLLYELLTGRHPFARPSVLEMAHAIVNEPPPPLAGSGRAIDPLLEHVVTRCLEKDRERRYQALSDVRIELDSLGGPTTGAGRPGRRWMPAAIITALVAAGAAMQWLGPLPFLAPEPALAFKERDWLAIADVNNLTGDAVFNRSLRLALEVAIAQSQYVNVYPRERVAATFRRMQRKPNESLDETAALEVARREQIRGVLACDIAQLGDTYSITARLLDPATGTAVLTESARAAGKDKVLDALDGLAKRVRSGLGESLGRLAEQGMPLAKATTSSLEALQLYTRAVFAQSEADIRGSNEMLAQALALDPDFALAHAELGRRLYLVSRREEREEGERHFAKALTLTDRLTLRERLWIQAIAADSRGNRERAVDGYTAYVAQYPDDARALFRLAWTQMAALNRLDDAAANFTRVIALDPSDSSAYVNLATTYSAMGKFDAALVEYDKAFARDASLLFGPFVNSEYGFTLVKAGRASEARPVFERMKTEAREAVRSRGFRSMAFLDMSTGRYGAALGEIRKAILMNRSHGERLSEYRDRLILASALQALGRTREAWAEWGEARTAIASMTLAPEWLWRPARMLARNGRPAEAKQLLQLMLKTTRNAVTDSTTNRSLSHDAAFVKLVEAEIDAAEGREAAAVEALEQVNAQLQMPDTLESLAVALASARRVDDAIPRFEQLVSGLPLGNEAQEDWFAAHARLGALYEQVGRTADARRIYASLADRWKEGDADLLLLRHVRARLARLPNP